MSAALSALVAQGLLSVVVAAPAGPLEEPAQPPPGLTVSPSRMVVPADQIAQPRQFTITNGTAAPVEVLARVASFSTGPDGNPVLRADALDPATSWVTLRPDRLRLEAAAAQPVTMDIAVPANAEPGEHQVAVIFSVPVQAGVTGIGVSGAVGAPVYLSVPAAVVDPHASIAPLWWTAGIVLSGLLLWLFRRRIHVPS